MRCLSDARRGESARSSCSPITGERAARRSPSVSSVRCRRSRPGCIAASRSSRTACHEPLARRRFQRGRICARHARSPASARRSPRAVCASRNWTPRSEPGRCAFRACPRPFRRSSRRAIFWPRSRRASHARRATLAARNETVVELTRRLRALARSPRSAARAWRRCSSIGVGLRESTRVAAPHEFVAVLQKSADSPAFVITVNLDTRESDRAPGRGAGAVRQGLRIVDHQRQARRAAFARRDRQANLTANPSLAALRSRAS